MVLVSGCGRPADWATDLEREVRCDMSIEEVKALTTKPLIQVDVPDDRMTHYISDSLGTTELRLVFDDGKLKSVQVVWAQRMMKLATYEKTALCGQEMGEDSPMYRMPDNRGTDAR